GGLALGAYATGDFGAGPRTECVRRVSALANAWYAGPGAGNLAGVDDANHTTISGHALVGSPARASTHLYPGGIARLVPSWISASVTVHRLAGGAAASAWAACRRCHRWPGGSMAWRYHPDGTSRNAAGRARSASRDTNNATVAGRTPAQAAPAPWPHAN